MSALPPKADIAGRRLDVRFVPLAEVLPFQERSRFEWNVSSIASRTLAVCWALPIDTVARSIFHQFDQPPSLPVRSGTWE
jgi:hypothetical protein